MRVIVAGGSGFIGRHVVQALLGRGHDVVVLSRHAQTPRGRVSTVACDVAREDVPLAGLQGGQAVVNLIGIKREQGAQTFEAVHVDATRRLIESARALGIRRFIQVSVVCSRPDAANPYHDTKWRAEELVRASGLEATILKPGVVYGPGDDMVTHLVRLVRFCPIFPVVGSGGSLLQPVDVRDVAEAVAVALERPQSLGRSYDVVGPGRHSLREVVRIVGDGTGLGIAILPTPISLQRMSVRLMDALQSDPLSTPSQLQMLIDGLVGDPAPARRDLGLAPRPFDAAAVAALEAPIPSLFGVSLRLVANPPETRWLAARAAAFPRALALAVAAILLIPLLGWAIPSVWFRMAANAAIVTPLAWLLVDVGWRELLVPSWRRMAHGALAAAVLYVLSAGVCRLLASLPGFPAQAATVYAWARGAPQPLLLPLLLVIVVGEELVWRVAVTLPFAARLGPWRGVMLAGAAFAAAHISLGVPLLLVAALGAGSFWGAMVVRSRSAVPALVCHLLWDVAVLFLWPLAAS